MSNLVSEEKIILFLNYVVRGQQDEAEAMLKLSPGIAVVPGRVIDHHAGREFRDITGLQIAICNLDWYMWEMILKYIPEDIARENVQEFICSAECQRLYVEITKVWDDLIEAYDDYINMINISPRDDAKCKQQWTTVISVLQKKLPMHVLQEYCHLTRPFHPCTAEIFKSVMCAGNADFSFFKLVVDFAMCRARYVEGVWEYSKLLNRYAMI